MDTPDPGSSLIRSQNGRPVSHNPVSYTHLDVYKRQAYLIRLNRHRFCDSHDILRQALLHRQRLINVVVPVSYTHLDVYKRQSLSSATHIIGVSQTPICRAMLIIWDRSRKKITTELVI